MARIRTIKPEFWTDGAMIGLPFETRLFYIGMWNHACDKGHLPDDPIGLKLKILPADPVNGADLIEQLVTAGRVVRVILPDQRAFLAIPRFTDHQRLDSRWNSRCPVCAQADSLNPAETHASLSDLTPGGEGRGGERKGEEGKRAEALTPFCKKHPGGTTESCRACGNARRAYEAAEKAERNKPTQTPPKLGQIPEHRHVWVADGTCTYPGCIQRKDAA